MRARNAAILVIAFFAVLALAPLFGAEWTRDHAIIFGLRLPRLLFAALVGGCLAMLGATYQILFHNPLSEPYVLGVSSGATLVVVLGEMFFQIAAVSVAGGLLGVIGGVFVALFIILFASMRSEERPEHLILFGVGINFVISSLLFILLSFQFQSSSSNFRFLFGQIPWLSWNEVAWTSAVGLPLLLVLWLFGRKLDALSFGDETARTMGTNPSVTRNVLILLTSLLVSLLVIYTGSIGFVGLAIPHVARLWLRPQGSRALLFSSFFLGGIFLIVSDVASRIILPPFEFPVGTVTTILGGPILLYLLWKR